MKRLLVLFSLPLLCISLSTAAFAGNDDRDSKCIFMLDGSAGVSARNDKGYPIGRSCMPGDTRVYDCKVQYLIANPNNPGEYGGPQKSIGPMTCAECFMRSLDFCINFSGKTHREVTGGQNPVDLPDPPKLPRYTPPFDDVPLPDPWWRNN